MASNFSIESVSATPTFATSNWNGIVNNAVGQHSVIWDTTRSYDNGVNGSTNPVTIKYPINSTLVPVGLRASFQATAPVPGQRNGYVVQASLNNTIILQSQPGGITAGGSQNISVIEMLLVNPNPVTAPLPIRQSGNFQFQLVITAGTIQTRGIYPVIYFPRTQLTVPWENSTCNTVAEVRGCICPWPLPYRGPITIQPYRGEPRWSLPRWVTPLIFPQRRGPGYSTPKCRPHRVVCPTSSKHHLELWWWEWKPQCCHPRADPICGWDWCKLVWSVHQG